MDDRALGVVVASCLTVAGLLGGTGCTSGDIVSSGRNEMLVAAVPSPPVDSVYAHARARISQLALRPVNTTADRALGSAPVGLLHSPVTADLKSSSGTTLDRVALGRGEYSGLWVRIGRIELNTDASAPAGTDCSGDELISVAVESPLEVEFGPADRFTVPASGEVVLELRVDGAALAALLRSKCSGGSFTFPTDEEFEAARVFSLKLE